MVNVIRQRFLCVLILMRGLLSFLFATLILSVTSVVGFVFHVLSASVPTTEILHLNSLSVFLVAELCPCLLGMFLLNVLLVFFTIEVSISIVKPCPCVPNSALNFVY